MRAVLRTDGGARGNPGPGGAGFVLEDVSGGLIASGGKFLGEVTNNVAEYEALLWGLRVAAERGVSHLTVYSDSELLVKQMNGVYRCKHPNMIPLYKQAKALVKRFDSTDIQHVRREQNADADRLANEAMDARDFVGTVREDVDRPAQGTLFG
ncbi:MAG: ribonuclease HI family protein [Candidatus Eisenbacteria bacterium]|nr:ribonuclease HI family protein [Candidatus Eisenbacteria bacterium]